MIAPRYPPSRKKMSFFEKLESAIARNQSLLVVELDPDPEVMPPPGDWWEWLQFLITQTSQQVCAYKLTLGFYQAMGAAGLELLSQTLSAIPNSIPIILDAQYGDTNTSTVFAQTAFEQWQVDAITLNPYAGQDQVAPFLVYSDKAVFVTCRTANPAAAALQEYPSAESPLYLQVAKEARNWASPEQLGLEVEVTTPDALAQIRVTAPERVIFAPGMETEGENLAPLLAAGLNENGEGLLIPIPLNLLGSENPVETLQSLNAQVNQVRGETITDTSSCNLWMPNVCLLTQHPHQDLILQLYDLDCILFGDFTQASGARFPYYIDLRKIISNPQVFQQVLNAYANILKDLNFDRIAGIPYGSLPTATGLSLRLHRPMIFPRKEVKAYGTSRVVEGNFYAGETVAMVDDILISGKSAIEGAAKLQSVGLVVEDIVVFMDHEGGVKERLKENGYRAHSVLTISEITETLYEAGRINDEQLQALAKA